MRATGRILIATAALAGATVAVTAAPLAPHRAVYDLTLEDASDRSGITGLAGRMVYEFDGSACDGYTVNFRFVTRIDTAEMSRLSDMQTTTYEDGEGRSFDFVSKSFVDQTLDKEVKGSARLGADNVEVKISRPEPRTVEVEKTQFPTRHLVELIEKARAGETFYETTIFDGSEDADKVMTTTVVIGRKEAVQINDPERQALAPLDGDEYWPVDIAYFDLSAGEEVPSYRISFKLHENGFTRDLIMDYGDFSMVGKLVDLKMLDAPSNCPTR